MFWKMMTIGLRAWAAPSVTVAVLAAYFAATLPVVADAAVNPALTNLRSAGAKAEKDCDPAEDEDIQKARTKAKNLSANQQSDKASNPMRACQDMQGAAADASKALTEFKTRCEPTAKKCKEALEKLESVTLSARDKEFKEACEKLKTDMSRLESEIGKSTMQAKASEQCQQDIGGGQMPQLPQMPTSSPSPTPTPKIEEPKQDCNNPTFASTNPVCVCQANPWAVGCGTDQSPSVDALINDSSQSVEPTSYAPAGGGSAPRAAHDPSRTSRYEGQGGGGGGGVSASSPMPAGRDNPKADAMVQIPASGIGKGGGGGGGGEGGGGTSAAGGGYREDDGKGGRRPGSAKNDAPGADLKKFLPDGMTGPHTNLFHKVRVRYRANTSTLNP